MRRYILVAGLLLSLLPTVGRAQSMFDLFYDEAIATQPYAYPDRQLTEFVIEEMKTWHESGIQLTSDDIRAALEGGDKLPGILCTNKQDASGEPIAFVWEGSKAESSCLGLRDDVLALLFREQDASQLGADLLTITSGSELAAADEAHRPVDMGKHALNLRRIWTGTGAGAIPWEGTTTGSNMLYDLEAALGSLDSVDLNAAVLRYRHGYYRDQHEADPEFASVAMTVGVKLKALGDYLGVTDDPTAVGEFSIPAMTSVPNVAVWARKDDIGLLWVYPSHLARLKLKRAGTYPVAYPDGERLAYPFTYSGSTPLAEPYQPPVCSRTTGRYGYLCRPLPQVAENCTAPSDDGISLVQCSQETLHSDVGPYACTGLDILYDDDGEPIVDPANPGHINPNLTPADLTTLCTPDTRIQYQDDIRSHACYVAHCLIQSMNKHTLVPNRNTVLVNESTSPYMSCLRRDPQLGRYMQVPYDVPFAFPAYMGHELVVDFEREYCVKNGNAPHPLAGFCAYRSSRRTRSPSYVNFFQALAATSDQESVMWQQQSFPATAAAIGDRAASEQMATIQRKTFGAVAAFVQQIADLFLELKNASLTKTPCPWTGPFRPS